MTVTDQVSDRGEKERERERDWRCHFTCSTAAALLAAKSYSDIVDWKARPSIWLKAAFGLKPRATASWLAVFSWAEPRVRPSERSLHWPRTASLGCSPSSWESWARVRPPAPNMTWLRTEWREYGLNRKLEDSFSSAISHHIVSGTQSWGVWLTYPAQ